MKLSWPGPYFSFTFFYVFFFFFEKPNSAAFYSIKEELEITIKEICGETLLAKE